MWVTIATEGTTVCVNTWVAYLLLDRNLWTPKLRSVLLAHNLSMILHSHRKNGSVLSDSTKSRRNAVASIGLKGWARASSQQPGANRPSTESSGTEKPGPPEGTPTKVHKDSVK